MTTIGIRELKQNASAVVARVAAGESFTITDRGRPSARMTPLEATALEHLYAAGAATPPRHAIVDFEWPTASGELSTILSSMRDDERY